MWTLKKYLVAALPYAIASALVYICIRRKRLKVHGTKIVLKQELINLLFVMYIAVVAKLTIIPDWMIYRDLVDGQIKFFSGITEHQPINMIPFKNIMAFLEGNVHVNEDDVPAFVVLNLVGNILLLLPLGYFLPTVCRQLRKWGRIILASAGISFLIEFIQYFISRAADVDDFLLNLSGMVLGYLLWKVRQRRKSAN